MSVRIGDGILVLERDDRQRLADHLPDPSPIIAGGIDHHLANHIAPVACNQPVARGAPGDRAHGGEAGDGGAQIARALGQGLGQLTGIGIPFVRIVKTADDARAGRVIGMHRLHLARCQHAQIIAKRIGNTDEVAVEVDPFLGLGGPEGSGMAIGDRGVDGLCQILVEPPGIVSRTHAALAVGIGRDVAGGVPGRAAGQFVLLDQQRVADAGLGQVIEDRHADRTTTYDDDMGMGFH